MPVYTIVPQPEAGYQINVVADDGTRHTMLGFETEADAQAWITADQKNSWTAPREHDDTG